MFTGMHKRQAFTIMELMMIIVIIAVLAGLVFIAINPMRNFAESRNAQRSADINAILSAVDQYSLDHSRTFPNGIDQNLRMIGTSATGCNMACGEKLPEVPVANSDFDVIYSLFPKSYALSLADNKDQVEDEKPNISMMSIVPNKVLPGDIMHVKAYVKASNGVAKLTVNLGGIEILELHRIDGDKYQGSWEGEWLVHDTKQQYYAADFLVIDEKGFETKGNVSWSDPVAGGWVSPDEVQAPTGQWTDLSRANDRDTVTYATNAFGGTGWGQYIYFNLNTAITSDRLRLIVDYMASEVSQVQIDVFKDGAWVNVFLGGDEANWNAKWVEVAFPVGQVTQARFRYNYSAGGYYYWLYEFQFYQTSSVHTLPVVTTQDAALIQDVYATVHASLNDDGGEPCEYRFVYGLTTDYGQATAWVGGATSGDNLSAFINGLNTYTNYHVRVEARNSMGTSFGVDKVFQTQLPILGDFSPPNYSDETNNWTNMAGAVDSNIFTYARSLHAINTEQWSAYLYFSQDARYTNAVTFMARGLAEVDQAQIDIHVNGSWLSVFSGSFNGMQNKTVTFSEGLVDQARIRFHATSFNQGFFWQLYEFSMRKSSENTADACVDLSGLVPVYIAGIPTDPQQGNASKTFYAIKKLPTQRLMVYSCQPELGVSISVKR
jgi:competence protein ComGC